MSFLFSFNITTVCSFHSSMLSLLPSPVSEAWVYTDIEFEGRTFWADMPHPLFPFYRLCDRRPLSATNKKYTRALLGQAVGPTRMHYENWCPLHSFAVSRLTFFFLISFGGQSRTTRHAFLLRAFFCLCEGQRSAPVLFIDTSRTRARHEWNRRAQACVCSTNKKLGGFFSCETVSHSPREFPAFLQQCKWHRQCERWIKKNEKKLMKKKKVQRQP